MITFNKPFLTGKETKYIRQAVKSGKLSGDGIFTKKCHAFFEEKFGFIKVLLTTSCTDALEMVSLLINTDKDSEIIAPSFTFVSSVNPFVLRGAKIIFADSRKDQPNIDEDKLEDLITKKTKAIVVVHYAGVACDMDKILKLAKKYNLFIIEDSAHSIDSFYKNKPLGSIGDFGAFSFHETKNVISGEGGMITINNKKYINRAEVIREKGTNRSAFFRDEVNKYGWIDIGSSFLPSEVTAAFLYAQLENLKKIQKKRKLIWNIYFQELKDLEKKGFLKLPYLPDYATNNGHMFYIVCRTFRERTKLIEFMKKKEIYPVFHYLSLHKSPFFKKLHDGRNLPEADNYSKCLLRLPFFYELKKEEQYYCVKQIYRFYQGKK